MQVHALCVVRSPIGWRILPARLLIAPISVGLRQRILKAYDRENETCVSRAVAAGAAGYLPKSVSRAILLKAIRCVVKGGTFYSPEIITKLRESRCRTPLSPRELEILRLIVDGPPNKLISCILGISENTVKLHITHLLSKTGATDRTSVVNPARMGEDLNAPPSDRSKHQHGTRSSFAANWQRRSYGGNAANFELGW